MTEQPAILDETQIIEQQPWPALVTEYRGHHRGGSSSEPPDLAEILMVLGWAMKTGRVPAEWLAEPGIKRGVRIDIDIPHVRIAIGPLPSKLT